MRKKARDCLEKAVPEYTQTSPDLEVKGSLILNMPLDKHYYIKLVSLITLLVCIVTHSHGLHIKGKWRTGDEFFHFLAKFGFQKTSPRERVLTEGYIFGNVTSDTVGGVGTLALLPRQFFVDFYRNRTKAATDRNLACHLMFKVSCNIC